DPEARRRWAVSRRIGSRAAEGWCGTCLIAAELGRRTRRDILWRGVRVNRRDEPVSPLVQSLDETRRLRRVPQGLPEAIHRGIQSAVILDVCTLGPYPLAQLLARDELPRPFQQCRQDAEGLM